LVLSLTVRRDEPNPTIHSSLAVKDSWNYRRCDWGKELTETKLQEVRQQKNFGCLARFITLLGEPQDLLCLEWRKRCTGVTNGGTACMDDSNSSQAGAVNTALLAATADGCMNF
jgi:hypothetical protein